MAVSSQRVQRFGICLNQPTIKQIFMSINQKKIALENSYQRLTQQFLNFDKYFYHNQKHQNYQNNPCPTFRCKVINYVLIHKNTHSFAIIQTCLKHFTHFPMGMINTSYIILLYLPWMDFALHMNKVLKTKYKYNTLSMR